MSKSIVVYLPEEFADWEGAFLLPELRQIKKPITIVSETGGPVLSIGGLKVHVDGGLTDVSPENTEALILIGSDTWPIAAKNEKILKMVPEFHKRGVLIGAICAATVALARIGMLDGRKHTSNDLGALKQLVPTYRDEKNYQEELAVTDGNLITASGVGYLEFTMAVMRHLNIYNEEKRQQWYALYRSGIKPPLEFWS